MFPSQWCVISSQSELGMALSESPCTSLVIFLNKKLSLKKAIGTILSKSLSPFLRIRGTGMWRYSSKDWICWFFSLSFLQVETSWRSLWGCSVGKSDAIFVSVERPARHGAVVLILMRLWIFQCAKWSLGWNCLLWYGDLKTTGTLKRQSYCFSKKIQPPEQIRWMDT